jgi:dTDP-4-dehydrorhamnose 3,5-epimerase
MTEPSIPGVRFGTVQRHADDRGAFRELWRGSTIGPIHPADAGRADGDQPTFVQANLSTSSPGVVRGLHLHRRQLDRWVIGSGRAFVALVDVRPMLAGGSAPIVETSVLDADDWVQIPAGVAHGFMALEPVELVYLGEPVLSERDRSNPSLVELVERLRAEG